MIRRIVSETVGRPRWIGLALSTAIVCCLAGCGDDNIDTISSATLYPVKGKVLLPDGKPLDGSKVVFIGPVTAYATTESDGSFAFKGSREGLPAGDYKVKLELGPTQDAAKRKSFPFPAHYADEDASDLTAKVKSEGQNDFELKLTKDIPSAGKKGRGVAGLGGHR